MNKIIYDKNLGYIRATCRPEQDHVAVMSNYQNVDFIEVEFLPHKDQMNQLKVNIKTKQLENEI